MTEKLKQYFERARTIKSEIQEKREDLSQIFKDAKGDNIDTVVLKRILREDSMIVSSWQSMSMYIISIVLTLA